MSRPFKSSMAAAALLLASVSHALSAQAPGGRIEVRALFGAAVPAGPAEFSGPWNTGVGGSLGAEYRVAPQTDIGASIEYQHFGYTPDVFVPPDPMFRTKDPDALLWAAWLDASRRLTLDPKLGARLHAGFGVVAMGAARTGLGLHVGAGLDAPVSTHFSMIFDATFAHAFTQAEAEGYALSTPFSYLPLRAGVSWR